MDNEKIIRKPIRFHEKSLKLFAKASLLAREIGFTFVAKEMIYVGVATREFGKYRNKRKRSEILADKRRDELFN